MPKLSYTSFDGTVHTHEIRPGTTRLGRTADNDFQIDDLAVSAHHCEIRCAGETMVVRDLDSLQGTCLDGEPIRERELKVGQVLSLGTVLLRVQDSDPSAIRPPSGNAATAPAHLPDGSYSCLRHQASRALFECPECFDLACADCVRPVALPDGTKEAYCRSCGAKTRPIDWSGLTMDKKEALRSLLPDPVQKALDFWEKRRRKPGP